MKKTLLFIAIIMLSGIMLSAQSSKEKIEVLYFKANLACCKARACNALETDIQTILQRNFADSSVVLKEIKLSDSANKALIEKYKAQSQTVIILKSKKKKETSADVSDIVKTYVQNQNKEALEKALLAKINEVKKKK
jgi:hypothetical protein